MLFDIFPAVRAAAGIFCIKSISISAFIPTFVAMKNIEIHLVDLSTTLPLPYADEGIRAGFPSPARIVIRERLMNAIDSINGKYGNSVKLAVQGQGTGWKLKQEQLSKHYTTDLGEIIEINCRK